MKRERWFVYSLIFIKSEQLFIKLTKILIYSTLELDKYWICQKISFHKFNFCLNRFLNIFLQFIIIQVEKICIILKTFYQIYQFKSFFKNFSFTTRFHRESLLNLYLDFLDSKIGLIDRFSTKERTSKFHESIVKRCWQRVSSIIIPFEYSGRPFRSCFFRNFTKRIRF